MGVTELAWVTSKIPGNATELIKAVRDGVETQSEWTSTFAYETLPAGKPAARGAALYQQREDRAILLITAHWASVAQHEACIASELNEAAMGLIAENMVPSKLRLNHVADVWMFPAETLEAGGLLSVVKLKLKLKLRAGAGDGNDEKTKKGKIEETWTNYGKRLLADAAGFEHRAGWRVERDEEDNSSSSEEFVIVGAWKDESALEAFAHGTWTHASAWEKLWKDVVSEMDVKTYDRVA